MIKFIDSDTQVLFSEVPNEISLGLAISNCQFNCKGCHSQHLRTDTGTELTNDILDDMIKENIGISAVCILGEGNDPKRLEEVFKYIKENHNLNTCLYTSNPLKNVKHLFKYLDYIKVGPYLKKYGPLNKETTNQRMYTVIDGVVTEDITHRFYELRC